MKQKQKLATLTRCVLTILMVLGFTARGVADDAATLICQTEFFPLQLNYVSTNLPAEAESQALLDKLNSWPSASWTNDVNDFMAAYPNSAWNPALKSGCASVCRQVGLYSSALTNWEAAWNATKDYTNGAGKVIADHTLAYWASLLASLGRKDQLEVLITNNEGRVFSDPYQQSTFNSAKEGYETMVNYPELAYRCGTFALFHVAKALGSTNTSIYSLKDQPSTTNGITMARLMELSAQCALNLEAVERPAGAQIIVPSVIHWAQNHYAAILASNDVAFWVKDPTFGGGVWMPQSVIDAEASGKLLVPTNSAPTNWHRLTTNELAAIFGKGQPNNIEDWRDEGCDMSPAGRGGPSKGGCPPCNRSGMATWWVTEPYINLWAADEPLSYTLSHGGKITFRWMYRHRRSLPANVFLFPTRTPRTTNQVWEHNWMSHIQIRDPYAELRWMQFGTNPPNSYMLFSNYEATVFLPGGSVRTYSSVGTNTDARSADRFEYIGRLYVATSGGTNYFYPNNLTNGFRIVHPDGSQDLYTLQYKVPNTPAGNSRTEMLQTARIDPNGRITRLAYQPTNSGPDACTRLVHVIDCDGRTNIFRYVSSGNGAATNQQWRKLVMEIEDPYGRKATNNYDATYYSSGVTFTFDRLRDIRDSEGNLSQFDYGFGVSNIVLGVIRTPYGDTVFRTYESIEENQGNLGGHNMVNRYIKVTEPNAAEQLYMYRYDSPNFLPHFYPTSSVPVIPGGLFLLDNGDASNPTNKASLHFRNSVYWSRKTVPGLSSINPVSLVSNDFRYARVRHWLDSANDEVPLVSDQLSLERLPSPDGAEDGQLTWFSYPGKVDPHRIASTDASLGALGDENFLGLAAQVLPDGTTQFQEFWHRPPNQAVTAAAFPVLTRSSYTTASGTVAVRTNRYEYHTNSIDLLRVIGADGDLEERYAYNTNHQVTAFTNAVGDVTVFGYDTTTHNLTVVQTPAGLTRQFTYYVNTNANGANAAMLGAVNDVQIGRSNTFSYTKGLPFEHTNELGLRMTYTWDKLDRLTSIGYPDNTTISNRYDKLDLAATKDRLGNWSYFGHDYLGRLVAVTNVLQQVTQISYGSCGCGGIESITDSLTNTTTFSYDAQVRLTNTLFADGSRLSQRYDPLGRLTVTTDGADRSLLYGYNNQNLVTVVSNAYGPVLRAVYDTEDRPLQITDAAGVTVANSFDNEDRVIRRAFADGGVEQFFYEKGLFIIHTNQLNQRTLVNYDSARRLTAVTNANLEVTRFTNDPAGNLKKLTDGNANLTQWNYDVFGRLISKVDAQNRTILTNGYDANNRLTARWTAAKGLTTYLYDALGNLRTNNYPSSTALVFTYDALNRLTNMTDAAGSTRFGYTQSGQLQFEDGPWADDTLSFGYTEGQRTGMVLSSQPAALNYQYGFDAARRLHTIVSPAGAFSYDYGNGPASLIRKLTLPSLAYITNSYDSMARLKSTLLKNRLGLALDGASYDYDVWSQRTNVTRWNGSKVAYRHDPIGQLKNAVATESNGTPRLNEYLGYAYDSANNLLRRTNNTLTQTFTSDSLNQLSNVGRSGTLTVAGLVTRPAISVTANGQSAALYNDQTWATTAGLSLLNGTNIFTVIAQAVAGGNATNTLTLNLPDPVSFQYDTNGNLLSDGRRTFEYDDENQLTAITVSNAWRSEFVYDGLFRRRVRKEYTWSGAVWLRTNEIRYVYDGALVFQERDSNNVAQVTFTRGLDLSGGMQSAGGIGGLLARTDITGHYFFHADGEGSVTTLMDSGQGMAARYLYDPFGNLIAKSGPLADANLYRFSSKELHPLSGTYSYGRRFYEPNLQRWLNRDPLGEIGGVNLYGYVENDPLNGVDPYGLWLKYLFQKAPTGIDAQGNYVYDEYVNPGLRPQQQPRPPKQYISNADLLRLYGAGPDNNFNGKTAAQLTKEVGMAVPKGIAEAGSYFIGVGEERAAVKAGEKLLEKANTLKKAECTVQVATKAVNLPAWKKVGIDMAHVAERHMAGGHLTPGRTVFPENMTEKAVERAIRQAYRFGEKVSAQGERVLVRGEYDGLTIEMWVNRETKIIETAYPIR